MWRWSRLPGLLTLAAALFVVTSAQAARPLYERVLAPEDLPGFTIDRPLEIAKSAQAWTHAKRSGQFKESAALQARGFVVGAREHLNGDRRADAWSGVIEFNAPRGARATLGQTIAGLRSGSYALKRFAVPGIPGALGAATSAVERKGVIVAFTDGRFWYAVSVSYPPNKRRPSVRTITIAAARALYRRVHAA
jgi:hypothetical protein